MQMEKTARNNHWHVCVKQSVQGTMKTFDNTVTFNLFSQMFLRMKKPFYYDEVSYSIKQYKMSCEFGLNLKVSQNDGHLGFSTVSNFQCPQN